MLSCTCVGGQDGINDGAREGRLQLAIELLLSRRGAGVRRVLLEADMTASIHNNSQDPHLSMRQRVNRVLW